LEQIKALFLHIMKQSTHKILTFLLAVQVMLSSTGFAFYEHTCSMSLNKKVTFHPEKACCDLKPVASPDENQPQFKQGICCETQVNYQKLDTKSGFDSKVQFKAQQSQEVTPASFFNFEKQILVSEAAVIDSQINAPPQTGRSLLTRFCLLRI
jgi:hypothetical protein